MFNPSFLDIIVFICAYLLGSISTSILACKSFGLPDPRTVGSKNAGATNVLRISQDKFGKKVAIIALIGDVLKGVIPVLIGIGFGFNLVGLVIVGFFALLGHIYPIFFGFRGGKGVATFIGVLLTIHPLTGISFVAIWLFVAKVLKISSLSALIATLLTPIIFYFLTHNITASVLILAICVLIFITHKSNIIRLINKQEGEINAG
jgi:glycerol-3-phosphate acyltransferase PlsY